MRKQELFIKLQTKGKKKKDSITEILILILISFFILILISISIFFFCRNYHVFYQFLAGCEDSEKKEWQLGEADDFYYTRQGKASLINDVDDVEEFDNLKVIKISNSFNVTFLFFFFSLVTNSMTTFFGYFA